MKVLIGVDGGASTTNFIALSEDGRELASSSSLGINYNFIGLDEALNNLLDGIKKLNIDEMEIMSLSIGNPAKDDLTIDEGEKEFVRRIQDSFSYSFPVHVKSDAFMALYGLLEEKSAGALLISGTGSMGIGINEKEKIYIVGGWGRPTNDDGSAYDIGVKGLEAAFKYADGIGPYTELTRAYLDCFCVKEIRDLVPILNSSQWARRELAGLASIVSDLAKEGDREALRILEDATTSLVAYGKSLVEKIGNQECVFGIYGGVFQNSKLVREGFSKRLKEIYPKIKICFPDMKAEKAAALYALRRQT